MFYVYDVNGLQFQGSMETFEQAKRVQKSKALKGYSFEDQLAQTSEKSPTKSKALSAYQENIQKENMLEPLVHIYQIMSSPVSTILPTLTIVDAWSKLQTGGIRQLVVTNEKKVVIGVLADKDILRHLNVDGDTINVQHNLTVAETIDKEVITTDSMSDIRRVARVMAYYHIDAIPALQDGALVGIVTRGDILRNFAENQKLNLWG